MNTRFYLMNGKMISWLLEYPENFGSLKKMEGHFKKAIKKNFPNLDMSEHSIHHEQVAA